MLIMLYYSYCHPLISYGIYIYIYIYMFIARYILSDQWHCVIIILVIKLLTQHTGRHRRWTSFTLRKAFPVFHNKSASWFTTECGRGNSGRERKPGECCEQKGILSCHCLDLHTQREDKLSGKLMLISIDSDFIIMIIFIVWD